MNLDFYHDYTLQSYCCNLHYILAYLLFSVSNKPLSLPLPMKLTFRCYACNILRARKVLQYVQKLYAKRNILRLQKQLKI